MTAQGMAAPILSRIYLILQGRSKSVNILDALPHIDLRVKIFIPGPKVSSVLKRRNWYCLRLMAFLLFIAYLRGMLLSVWICRYMVCVSVYIVRDKGGNTVPPYLY